MASHIDKMANTLKSPFKNRLSFNNGTSSDEKDTAAAMGENNTPIVALESSGDDGVVDAMSETNGTSARTDSPSSADSMSGVEEDSDVHDLSRNENNATTTEDGGELLVAEGRNEIMMDRSLHTISDEGAMGDDSGEGNAANSDDGVTASEEMKISNKDNLDVSSESMNKSSSNNNNNNILPDNSCPKWSKVLSTPSDCAPFTPAVDMSSWKENLHGLGLKHSVERAKLLSRTGKGCATLLIDIASLHEELSQSILKLCPSTLDSAASGTPMNDFANDVNSCVSSFANQTQTLGFRIRNDVARPLLDSSVNLGEETHQIYSKYVGSRGKCAQARKDAVKMRQKYVGCVREANGAIQALRRAKSSSSRRRKKSSDSVDSNCTPRKVTPSSPQRGEDGELAWEDALRGYGGRYGLTKNCDSVIRALEEVQAAEAQYTAMVKVENAAVADSQTMELKTLDAVQKLEEERIVYLLETFQRLLQAEKVAFDGMELTLHVQPLDLKTESNHKQLPVPSSAPAMFSPRRRTQSEDGPAINETRMLNLPDNVAILRDSMKRMIGRQSARLKTLKSVFAFNEGVASAIEIFAAGIFARLESEGYAGKVENKNALAAALYENEGGKVVGAWNCAVDSLKSYAKFAAELAQKIKRGNVELDIILVSAEKELKIFYESEDTRWKYLCDAAKGETKAKVRRKQNVADLEKAKTKVTLAEGEGSSENADETQTTKSAQSVNKSLGKMFAMMPGASEDTPANKMAPSVNKAMGKMFSMMPGGGEDVMAKVLKPEQRLAIAKRNLDEAKAKELKATESFDVATSVKQQAITSYVTEAEAAEYKFKSDDRYAWNEMQKSLQCSISAMGIFRECHQESLSILIKGIAGYMLTAMPDDITQWTTTTEKLIKKYRTRRASEMKEKSNEFETGFSLGLHLEDSTDVKELVSLVIADEDGITIEEEELDQSTKDDEGIENKTTPLPDVPPDAVMAKMDPIFTKKLKNVSIEKYYSAGWSEDIPLYGPWLKKKGSFDISVSDWEYSDSGFENPWSGEKFPQKRIIKFKFKRTTHLYIGPPIAGVTQTQYCLPDGNDRCIMMMTVAMDGIPYSDVFAVEVRWAARRIGNCDIVIDAGVFVRFLKSSMFANKIKSGTLTETKPIHLDLFEVVKLAIASDQESAGDLEVETEEETETLAIMTPSVKEEEKADKDIMQQLTNIFQNFASAAIQSPQYVQIMAVFVSMFFLYLVFRKKSVHEPQSIDDLARKVDQMTVEMMEMKAMLESIIKLMGEHMNERDEL